MGDGPVRESARTDPARRGLRVFALPHRRRLGACRLIGEIGSVDPEPQVGMVRPVQLKASLGLAGSSQVDEDNLLEGPFLDQGLAGSGRATGTLGLPRNRPRICSESRRYPLVERWGGSSMSITWH